MDEINDQLVPVIDASSESDEYLIEITTHIREDQAWALELLGVKRQIFLGVNFDKATLIREALDLLIEKRKIRTGKWPDKQFPAR
ncbi:MAG: hypothetical protein J2P52_11930 [Blastocatellia bacterium]|nr:hypothetical protein [Blastocatellia bacterium]